ncbi:hypothetical protein NH8B_0985 [Pseudogulbenkiania sp. NH8B]|uniref:hypothetical protein n=1 Tax=Pseudogulbenkiania sp. (strain NH8B) TaxID=748280 RepID=UPI0002279A97|nr:hypothetical protein [Pseudogulbenkiania sp. NH8B]BAK75817.1 hypothetical protein NH8B_0985 [Pseudogulbenkiania sp. NH8B]
MFVINQNPIIKWPVKVVLPADGGVEQAAELVAHIRLLPPEQYESLTKIESSETLSRALEQGSAALSEFVADWESVRDPQGEVVPYSPEALRSALTGAGGNYVALAFWKAVHDVHLHGREKN